jgi:predicted nucleic acid-binding protein
MPVPKRLLLDTDIVIQLLKKRSDVYLLAATAAQLACPLWTLNKEHYPMSEIVLFEGL